MTACSSEQGPNSCRPTSSRTAIRPPCSEFPTCIASSDETTDEIRCQRLARDRAPPTHHPCAALGHRRHSGRLGQRDTLSRDHRTEDAAASPHAATVAHWSMYGVIAGLVLLGWALCNAHAIHLRLFGVIPLPDLVAADSDLADTLSDYHIWAAWVLLSLVVPHVLAALWHHYIRRDGVLTAMLPGGPLTRRPLSGQR